MELPYMLDIRAIGDHVFKVKLTKAWELMNAPEAPEPVKLGSKATRWFRDEVIEYARNLPRGRVYRSGKPAHAPAPAETATA